MANEIDIMKIHTGALLDLETFHKVLKKYGQKGKNGKVSASHAMALAMKTAVEDIQLDSQTLESVKRMCTENYNKRMAKRNAQKICTLKRKLNMLQQAIKITAE